MRTRHPGYPIAAGELLLLVAALVCVTPFVTHAQEKLVGATTATTGVVYENWSLPTAVPIATPDGSALVSGASQFTIPVALVLPLGTAWKMDVYSAYVNGQVRLENADGSKREGFDLTGMTDTRLRLVGKLHGDAVLLTAGVTAPTGRTRLNDNQLGALAVLSAPALRFRSPVLGAGAGATLGLILSHDTGAWGVAFGTSYEARGSYAPAEALQAGAPTTDLRPGNGIHASLAAEHTSGAVRHMLSIAADLYQNGELRNVVNAGDRSTLTLGPTYTASYELDGTAGNFESAFFLLGRYRSAFKLGGETITGSDRTEAEGGWQGFGAITPVFGLRFGLDGRYQTTGRLADAGGDAGETPDVGFAMAGAAVGGATFALHFGHAHGGWGLEPFVRGQLGQLDFGATTQTITGLAGGVTLTASF